jgi:hypothetical protein
MSDCSYDQAHLSICTGAKILYDNKFIYFAFSNADTNTSLMMTKCEAHLWEEELDEVYRATAKCSGRSIEVSAGNRSNSLTDIRIYLGL